MACSKCGKPSCGCKIKSTQVDLITSPSKGSTRRIRNTSSFLRYTSSLFKTYAPKKGSRQSKIEDYNLIKSMMTFPSKTLSTVLKSKKYPSWVKQVAYNQLRARTRQKKRGRRNGRK